MPAATTTRSPQIASLVAMLATKQERTALRTETELVRLGSDAVASLITATTAPDPVVRYRAVWILGLIGDPAGLPAIVTCTHDADFVVAYDAVAALGKMGQQGSLLLVIPHLLYWLFQPVTKAQLPSAAYAALVQIGAPAIPYLQPLCENLSAVSPVPRLRELLSARANGDVG